MPLCNHSDLINDIEKLGYLLIIQRQIKFYVPDFFTNQTQSHKHRSESEHLTFELQMANQTSP